jgi:carbon-monoxide dehydrogenase medium subunit
MQWEGYQVMASVKDTLDLLEKKAGRVRVVAGGTDLLIQIQESVGHGESLTLLDISQIEEIRGIKEFEGYIWIGAATTMAEIASSKLIRSKALALAQGASWLGSPQIRNVATLGGNVVNAQPAADASLPLVALGAEAKIVSPVGQRYVPVEELFVGVGESLVDPFRELISHFRIPMWEEPRRSSWIERLAKRKAFTLPTLSVSACIQIDETREHFQRVKIAVAPVAPIPWRARRAEEFLENKPITNENIKRAATAAMEDANPRHSLRGGSAYRKEMVEVLTRRALLVALSQLNKVLYD